jgi:hypothetical protein
MANKSVGFLTIAFGADLRGFDKAMKKAQRSIKKFGTSMQRTGRNLTRNLTLPLAAFAAASVKAFDEQIVAETKLLTALKGREDIQQRLITQAKELQTKTLFGDEETIKAQALLASLGLTEDQITMLIPQIQNMATGLSMDLVGATSLVSKSVSTTTDALARYFNTGLKGVTGQQERAIVLTQSLSEKFEGQAEAIRDKGLGAFKALGNAIGDVGEEFGEIITEQLQPLTEGFKKLTKTLANLTKEQKENIVFYGKIITVVGPLITILGVLAVSLSAIIGFFTTIASSLGVVTVLNLIGVAAMFVTDKFREFKNSKIHVDNFTSSVKELKKITDELGEPSLLFDPSGKNSKKFSTFQKQQNERPKRDLGITTKMQPLGLQKMPVNIGENGPSQTTKDFEELNNVLYQTETALDLVGQRIGATLSQGAENMTEFAKSTKNAMREAIGAVISLGVAKAVTAAMESVLATGQWWLIPIVAGLAGGLAKSAFNSIVPAFAEGGLVTGPTLGMVGEGAGITASNPEVIAPLNMLKNHLNGGGTKQVEVYGRISGNDIFLSNQKGGINRLRSV